MEPTYDADSTTTPHVSVVTLSVTNLSSNVQDFGYQGPGSIGDVIWNDLNGDGIRDAGEPGIPGVGVTITTTIAGSTVTYSATTDSSGNYSVAGLPLGAYTVTVNPATLPAGMTQTFDANGTATANTSPVTLTVAAPTSTTQDFGYQRPRCNWRLGVERPRRRRHS